MDSDRNPQRVARINWSISRPEFYLIVKIVERAERELEFPWDSSRSTRIMDIQACHTNGCPLDLEGMLTMPLPDFGHDFYGIQRYINRETGKLRDCFVPRCAKKQES